MYKAFILTALLALIAAFLWQRHEIRSLHERIEAHDMELIKLEAGLEDGQTGMALLYRFSLANHKNILGLKRKRKITVTAYSARAMETDSTPHLTATNKPVRAGIVAVSRDLFDAGWVFGKQVYVKNHGVFTIDDLMHSRKRNQIDIFMHSTQAAERFGVQELDVYLLDSPAPPLSESALSEASMRAGPRSSRRMAYAGEAP